MINPQGVSPADLSTKLAVILSASRLCLAVAYAKAAGSRCASFKLTSTGSFPAFVPQLRDYGAAGDFAQDDDAFRRGLRTSSPSQFGQVLFISSAHRGQKVHSYEQMQASPLSDNSLPHRSHFVRISKAMLSVIGPSLSFQKTIGATAMHKTNSIIMQAPRAEIFETAANLELWPKILPHYRYIKYLERSPERNIVIMAATRSGIPISWMSEQIIDRKNMEVHFHHLKAFTKGMDVVWKFREMPAGVLVEIAHDLKFRVPALAPVADLIIGDFFIHNIANKTLRCIKAYLEARGKRVAA